MVHEKCRKCPTSCLLFWLFLRAHKLFHWTIPHQYPFLPVAPVARCQPATEQVWQFDQYLLAIMYVFQQLRMQSNVTSRMADTLEDLADRVINPTALPSASSNSSLMRCVGELFHRCCFTVCHPALRLANRNRGIVGPSRVGLRVAVRDLSACCFTGCARARALSPAVFGRADCNGNHGNPARRRRVSFRPMTVESLIFGEPDQVSSLPVPLTPNTATQLHNLLYCSA